MSDPVNHPSHYTQGTIEVIDAIEGMGLPYHEGNIVKYVARWRHKAGVVDLKKARWYLERLIQAEETRQLDAIVPPLFTKTQQQVLELNQEQQRRDQHPLTCPHRGDDAHKMYAERWKTRDVGLLVATVTAWECPVCRYTQRYTA